jgi:triacylglycerol esterase/lipase EstA (alpha/beta hydrolase family)
VSRRHQVYLIPGFFGFSALGGISYFRTVRETLEDVFVRRGQPVEVVGVDTLPTASLKQRARRLIRTVNTHDGFDDDVALHFVGHSTGGLDARLVADSHSRLELEHLDEPLHRNLETVVTIATPHYGTPLSNFFTTLYGKNLLYLVTLLIIVGLWRQPISLLGGMLGFLTRINDLLGLDDTLIRQITDELLKEFNPEVEDEVRDFLHSILDDRGSMYQLTPEGMDIFNATVTDNPEVDYVSYATAAPPPAQVIRKIRLRHALTPMNKVLYGLLWTLTSRAHDGYPYHPSVDSRDVITGSPLPFELDESTSDGVVPTLSQIWGEFRGVVRADHLDVIGHYLRGPFDVQDGADWFGSGATFDRADFEWLWEDVAHVLLSDPPRD